MEKLHDLIHHIATARQHFIKSTAGFTREESNFTLSDETWSVVDNAENLVWAELGGINGMWKALEGFKSCKPIWKGEPIHHGLSIETIIEKTWQPREKAPEIAKPKWGGLIEFWIISLNNCQPLLESLGHALTGFDLEKIIHPHPISAPINILQRMEFLRFHLDRHRTQVENIKSVLVSKQQLKTKITLK